jgi:hypothetical protein
LFNATGHQFSNTNETFNFSQKIDVLRIKLLILPTTANKIVLINDYKVKVVTWPGVPEEKVVARVEEHCSRYHGLNPFWLALEMDNVKMELV